MALFYGRRFLVKSHLPIISSGRSLRTTVDGGGEPLDDYLTNVLVDAIKPNYLRRSYNLLYFWDRSFKKYNDNFKVVSVEGNIGLGKSVLAQRLAKEFGMSYCKDCTEDDIFKTDVYGFEFDYRSLNLALPDNIQLYDMSMLWNDKDPIRKGRPLALQNSIYCNRYFNYAKAMSLLWNTGTGFFTDRSPHSDWTFARAMRDCGLMSHEAYDWYEFNFVNTSCEMFRPHLIIHLKAPISYVRKQINEKNIMGKDSLNLTDKFLEILEENINEHVANIKRYSEVYELDIHQLDWNNPFEATHIADEISRIDLEGKSLTDLHPKFTQWRHAISTRDNFDNTRKSFTCANRKFLDVFTLIRMPDTLREGCFDRYDRLVISDAVKRHPVLAHKPEYHPTKFKFPMSLIPPRVPKNFEIDMPKHFLSIH